MSSDVLEQLRAYREHFEESLPTLEAEEVMTERVGAEPVRPMRPREMGTRRFGWGVALVAAAVVLIVAGGIVVWLPLADRTEPVIEPPSTTVPAPTTTVTPTTTEPPPTTVISEETATPTTFVPIAVDADVWAELAIGPPAFTEQDEISDIAVGGPGLVVVGSRLGEDERPDAVVWTSEDGLVWSRVPHDEELFGTGGVRMSVITRFGSALVATGNSCDDPERACPVHPQMWLSEDGLAWARAPWDATVFGGHTSVADVVAGGPGLVAVGSTCTVDGSLPTPLEWEAVMFGEATGEITCTFSVWTSPDALTWTQAYQDADPQAGVTSVTVGGPGFVAVGSMCCQDDRVHPVVWTSPDATNWTRVADQGFLEMEGIIDDVVAGGPGLVAGGFTMTRGQGEQATIWTSPDGTVWTRTHQESATHGGVSEIALGGPGLVAVGGDQNGVTVWTSTDGLSWTRISGPEAGLGPGFMQGVTAGGPGVIAVGIGPDASIDPAIWVTPPP